MTEKKIIKRPKKPISTTIPRVQRMQLQRLHDLDEAIELIYFGSLGTTRNANDYLAQFGFSQAHHRVLYMLARHAGLNVGELVKVLGISKQAAQRPIRQLMDGGYLSVKRDPDQHRSKILQLTAKGREIEHQASSHKRAVVQKAFGNDVVARDHWTRVMRVIAENA
jgi:DNA-binding MarR family transcriptional regulator